MQFGKVRLATLLLALLLPLAAAAQENVLDNPGFEDGLTGWTAFGNVFAETTLIPDFVPYAGDGLASMFGNWSGAYNVSGLFQEFPTSRGMEWIMTCKTRHFSGDPMIGDEASGGNFVVQKLAFFGNNGNEIDAVESVVLDGSYATDTWFDHASICGVAPNGTVAVQALVLYIQVDSDGGAAHIDNVYVCTSDPVPTDEETWGGIKALYR